MKTTWYYSPTAGHDIHGQGTIADEDTGRTVALAYDGAKDGALLAAAPELLEALSLALEAAKLAAIHDHPETGENLPWFQQGLDAIQKATTPNA